MNRTLFGTVSEDLKLSGIKRNIICKLNKKGWGNAAYTSKWITSHNNNVIKFSINCINRKGNIGVGIVSNMHHLKTNTDPNSKHSYLYYSHGHLFQDGLDKSYSKIKCYSGDKVSFIVHFQRKTIEIIKNNKEKDIIFTNIKIGPKIQYKMVITIKHPNNTIEMNSLSVSNNENESETKETHLEKQVKQLTEEIKLLKQQPKKINIDNFELKKQNRLLEIRNEENIKKLEAALKDKDILEYKNNSLKQQQKRINIQNNEFRKQNRLLEIQNEENIKKLEATLKDKDILEHNHKAQIDLLNKHHKTVTEKLQNENISLLKQLKRLTPNLFLAYKNVLALGLSLESYSWKNLKQVKTAINTLNKMINLKHSSYEYNGTNFKAIFCITFRWVKLISVRNTMKDISYNTAYDFLFGTVFIELVSNYLGNFGAECDRLLHLDQLNKNIYNQISYRKFVGIKYTDKSTFEGYSSWHGEWSQTTAWVLTLYVNNKCKYKKSISRSYFERAGNGTKHSITGQGTWSLNEDSLFIEYIDINKNIDIYDSDSDDDDKINVSKLFDLDELYHANKKTDEYRGDQILFEHIFE